MMTLPRKLYVELATRCNLNCAMCVKHSAGWNCSDALMERQTFEALMPVLEGLDVLNLNGVGESLLHPELPDCIAAARGRVPEGCCIGFQSNGMLLTPVLAERLVDAGLDRICFSVDSPDAAQLPLLRSGAVLETVARAFALMRQAAQRPGARSLSLGAETVLSDRNFEALPDMVDWCAAQGAGHLIVSHVLPYNAGDAARSLYVPVSQRCLELFCHWEQVFRAEGYDIRQARVAYLSVFNAAKNRRQIELMQAMMAEVSRSGLQFSLSRILSVDFGRLEHVRDVLARAAERAQELGIGLELPETAAREPRRCAFVSDPGMFVACDGTITPCYYLWHSYSSWLGGEEIPVVQGGFGRVPDDDPVAVWNAPDFVRFRSEAAGEEYARCGDCGVTPCDYLLGFAEPLARDCYGAVVPCGSCPWSGGGFLCMR